MTDKNIIEMLFRRKEEAVDKLIHKYGAESKIVFEDSRQASEEPSDMAGSVPEAFMKIRTEFM